MYFGAYPGPRNVTINTLKGPEPTSLALCWYLCGEGRQRRNGTKRRKERATEYTWVCLHMFVGYGARDAAAVCGRNFWWKFGGSLADVLASIGAVCCLEEKAGKEKLGDLSPLFFFFPRKRRKCKKETAEQHKKGHKIRKKTITTRQKPKTTS